MGSICGAITIFWLGFVLGCACCGWSPAVLEWWAARRLARRQQRTAQHMVDLVNDRGRQK